MIKPLHQNQPVRIFPQAATALLALTVSLAVSLGLLHAAPAAHAGWADWLSSSANDKPGNAKSNKSGASSKSASTTSSKSSSKSSGTRPTSTSKSSLTKPGKHGGFPPPGTKKKPATATGRMIDSMMTGPSKIAKSSLSAVMPAKAGKPPNSRTVPRQMVSDEKKPSMLSRLFAPKQPEGPLTINEFMALPRPKP